MPGRPGRGPTQRHAGIPGLMPCPQTFSYKQRALLPPSQLAGLTVADVLPGTSGQRTFQPVLVQYHPQRLTEMRPREEQARSVNHVGTETPSVICREPPGRRGVQGRVRGASAGLPWGQGRAQERGALPPPTLSLPETHPGPWLHLSVFGSYAPSPHPAPCPQPRSRGHGCVLSALHPPGSPPSHPCSSVLDRSRKWHTASKYYLLDGTAILQGGIAGGLGSLFASFDFFHWNVNIIPSIRGSRNQ